MTRSPSSRCLPTITLVTDCSARSVSPRQPISAPRSRPLMSRVIGSLPGRTCTCARTPMCLSRPSRSERTVSALPFASGIEPDAWAAARSMTLTSTTVSLAVSLTTFTSTLRRVSPSSIRAASTASSRVRPRPSADLISTSALSRCSFLRFLALRAAVGGPLRRNARLGRTRRWSSALRRAERGGRPAAAGPQVAPPDDETLLNDTDAVSDEPVEAQARRHGQGEEPDHHRRQEDHHSLRLLHLLLLIRRVHGRRLLQHLRLHERGRRREQREHEERNPRDRHARDQVRLVRDLHEIRHEQEVLRADVRSAEDVVERV